MRNSFRLVLAAASISAVSGTGSAALAGSLEPSDVDLSRLMSWIMSGQPDNAVREANEMIDDLRPTDDPDAIHLIGEILTFRCEAHNVLRQYADARASCLEAIAIFEEAEKDKRPAKWHTEDWHIARALSHLATTYAATGDLEGALVVSVKELERATKGRTGDPEKPGLLMRIGDLQLRLARFRDAEASFIDAIAAQAEVPRDERKMRAIPYLNLAILYRLEERHGRAEEVLVEGIADTEQTQAVLAERNTKFGLHSTDLKINAFNLRYLTQALGWIYFEQGRLDEAWELARSALEYYESQGDKWSWFASDTLVLLGRIEDARDPGTIEAKQRLTSAVNASRGGDALANIFRAFAQSELAHHHLLAGNLVAAEPYAQAAVRSLDLWLGADHYRTAEARANFARILHRQGNNEEAVIQAQSAYAAQQAYLPPYHSEIGETLALLAELYAALDQPENLHAIETLIAGHKATREQFESKF